MSPGDAHERPFPIQQGNYSGFGGEGAGPGLEPVGSPEERDRVDLHGYGTLWKHPHPEAGV